MAKDKRLKVGEIAPEFCLTEAEGNTVCLGDILREGKYLLLYFSPTEERKRCDRSSCPLKENLEKVQELGVNVAVVDPDPVEEHKRFKHDHGQNCKHSFLNKSQRKNPLCLGAKGYRRIN